VIGILTCGLPQASDVSAYPALRTLTAPADPDTGPIDHLVDAVAPALRQGTTVVAVVPTWDLEPTAAHLHAVRSALDTTRLVVHRTSLPPLAAAAFARTVADLAQRDLVDEGVLVSQLDAVETHVVGAAWLGSVAKLREPSPRVGLHARSWLPGASFGAVVDADPRVAPLRRKDEATIELPPPRLPGAWHVTVAAGTEGDAALVQRSISRHAPGATTYDADLGEVSIRWWGTAKLVELALVPGDVPALADALREGVTPTTCAWCGTVVATPSCPFCGDHAHVHAASVTEEQPSGGPA
jgi:hypothetical protein